MEDKSGTLQGGVKRGTCCLRMEQQLPHPQIERAVFHVQQPEVAVKVINSYFSMSSRLVEFNVDVPRSIQPLRMDQRPVVHLPIGIASNKLFFPGCRGKGGILYKI